MEQEDNFEGTDQQEEEEEEGEIEGYDGEGKSAKRNCHSSLDILSLNIMKMKRPFSLCKGHFYWKNSNQWEIFESKQKKLI